MQFGTSMPIVFLRLLCKVNLARRGHKFVRYADDCNVYVKSLRAGERVKASLTKYLEETLRLKVNRDKSAVDRPWKRKFLGYSFLSQKRAPIRLADKTIGRDYESNTEHALARTNTATQCLHPRMGGVLPTSRNEGKL